jgi:hypothetical protein
MVNKMSTLLTMPRPSDSDRVKGIQQEIDKNAIKNMELEKQDPVGTHLVYGAVPPR